MLWLRRSCARGATLTPLAPDIPPSATPSRAAPSVLLATDDARAAVAQWPSRAQGNAIIELRMIQDMGARRI
jgi:hypothetical protein